MLSKQPTFGAFIAKFSTANLRKWATMPTMTGTTMSGRDYCMYAPTAPTVGMMEDAYGTEKTAAWIAGQIDLLLETFSYAADRKPTEDMLMAIGQAWLSTWPQLKVTEVWVFFNDLLGGVYGQTAYGRVELSTLGALLADHMRQRLARQARVDERRRTAELLAQRAQTEAERAGLVDLYSSESFGRLTPSERERVRKLVDMVCPPAAPNQNGGQRAV